MLKKKNLEAIFAHAVALSQEGRLKNRVYCGGRTVFILNTDKTLLLRFDSPVEFSEPLSFVANEYDSADFYLEGDKVVFEQKSKEYVRKKYCPIGGDSFEEMEELWGKFSKESKGRRPSAVVSLSKEVLGFLEPDLSHVEFCFEEGRFYLV